MTEENFEEVHGRLRRGDIIGITGCPGELGRGDREAGSLVSRYTDAVVGSYRYMNMCVGR